MRIGDADAVGFRIQHRRANQFHGPAGRMTEAASGTEGPRIVRSCAPQSLALPVGQNTQDLGQPTRSKIILFYRIQKCAYDPPVPPDERGGSRSSRNAGGDAVDAGGVGAITQSRGGSNRERWTSRMTNGAGAYGKSVWSWLSLLRSSFRGDASTRPGLAASSIREATEAKRIRLRGEHAISRQATAQGRPGVSGFTCVSSVRHCASVQHRGHGCRPAPGLPCTLFSKRG